LVAFVGEFAAMAFTLVTGLASTPVKPSSHPTPPADSWNSSSTARSPGTIISPVLGELTPRDVQVLWLIAQGPPTPTSPDNLGG
jgi:hypothetical protein